MNQDPARKIVHVDMDCFYAAVEMRDRPELRGRAIAVGGSPEGRGVVATASYEARKHGVRSAMSSAKAARLCPDLIMVRPNFHKYRAESQRVREIFERFTDRIEPLSLDEAYLDLSGSRSATLAAREIRAAIEGELGLTASAGIGPNKFIAKVASEWNKPNGQLTVRPEDVPEFVKRLPIEKIWGVGRVTAEKIHRMGVRTCGDLQAHSIAELEKKFGSWGRSLWNYARGIDERPVRVERVRKSLSVETTYGQDLTSLEQCLSKVDGLFCEWETRFQRHREAARISSLVAKMKFSDFRSVTRARASTTYPTAKDFRELIQAAYRSRPGAVRLLGVGVKLEEAAKAPAKRPQLAFDFGES